MLICERGDADEWGANIIPQSLQLRLRMNKLRRRDYNRRFQKLLKQRLRSRREVGGSLAGELEIVLLGE